MSNLIPATGWKVFGGKGKRKYDIPVIGWLCEDGSIELILWDEENYCGKTLEVYKADIADGDRIEVVPPIE